MTYQRRPHAYGKPKLSPLLEARLLLAAEKFGVTPSDAMSNAVERWIAWSELEGPRRAFKAEKAAYDSGRSHISPDPVRHGLPPDFGMPRP